MSTMCPVCGAASSIEQQCADADLYRCAACDHCFSDPSSLKTVEEYGPEYYDEVHRNWFENPNIALFDFIGRVIADHKKDASVLDIGCGRGDLLVHLRKRHPELSLSGLDLSPNPLPDGMGYYQGDVLSVEIDRQFDAVVTMLVIEHVFDVRGFVRRLQELVAPGGILMITTINDRSVLYETSRMLYRLGVKGPCDRLYSAHHVNHFNVASLRKLADISGLSVKSTLLDNIPLAAVDMPPASPVMKGIMKTGVWGTFALGKLTGRTFLQTVVCTAGSRPGAV
jgi:SAM-dependent methyltransferase